VLDHLLEQLKVQLIRHRGRTLRSLYEQALSNRLAKERYCALSWLKREQTQRCPRRAAGASYNEP
jgi:hypothetical protein